MRAFDISGHDKETPSDAKQPERPEPAVAERPTRLQRTLQEPGLAIGRSPHLPAPEVVVNG